MTSAPAARFWKRRIGATQADQPGAAKAWSPTNGPGKEEGWSGGMNAIISAAA